MKIRDRIRGFTRLAPERIRPNPKNWRTHPEHQRDALQGVLADVGIADAVLVVPCDPDALAGLLAAKDFDKWLRGYTGDFLLVDGHLRAETITGQPVPALVLDLDDREQSELLAVFDPVGDLAGMDRERFLALAGEFNSTNAAVQTLVSDLADMDARMRDAVRTSAPSRPLNGGPVSSSNGTPLRSDDLPADAQRNDAEPPRAPAREQDPDGREYDESIADDVEMVNCPHCGKDFPAP